jgi:hypothetical protein
MSTTTKTRMMLKRIVPALRIVLVPTLLAVFALSAAGYWYVYGRQRELLVPTQKWVLDNPDGSAGKVVDWFELSPPLLGRLGLRPNNGGSELSGLIISEAENWIINRARVFVRITETRHCGEKLHNQYSDPDWDKNCAKDSNHSVEDEVDSGTYECFVGALDYLQETNCNAQTLLDFDPAKQHFEFSFNSVIAHPKDPLGVFH